MSAGSLFFVAIFHPSQVLEEYRGKLPRYAERMSAKCRRLVHPPMLAHLTWHERDQEWLHFCSCTQCTTQRCNWAKNQSQRNKTKVHWDPEQERDYRQPTNRWCDEKRDTVERAARSQDWLAEIDRLKHVGGIQGVVKERMAGGNDGD